MRLVALAVTLAACHAPGAAPRAPIAPVTPVAHAPGRGDIDHAAAMPLAELVQTGRDPCEKPPISDPSPNMPGRALWIANRPCRKPAPQREPRPIVDLP